MMSSDQDTLSDLFSQAVSLHRAAMLAQAEELYLSILAVDPCHAESLHLLGVLAFQTGRHELALEKIGGAIALKGAEESFHLNLGIIHRSRGELDKAIGCFERALSLRLDYAEALFNLGIAHQMGGRLDEAIARYEQALAIKPEYGEVLANLGTALQAQGKLDEAIARYAQAITVKPGYAEALSNLGTALRAAGRLQEAVVRYEEALALNPNEPRILSNLGNALREMGRLEEAVTRCEEALAIAPHHDGALANLASALQRQGRLGDAVERYEQVLALRPDYPEVLSNLGTALQEQGRIEESIARYRQAIAIRPDYAAAHSNLLMAMHYSAAISNDDILKTANDYSLRFESRQQLQGHANEPSPDRRLRVGYVSADFRSHPVGFFVAGVLPAHDRTVLEIFCYSNGAIEDPLTETLRQSADHWRRIVGLSDRDVARTIERDRIDILVDLSGHTAENRLAVFALKPAPVQVSWLGYPGTTGLAAMDYRLVDSVTDPCGEADRLASEQLVRLDSGFLCYAPPPDAPDPAAPPCLDGTPVTYGSFNNPAKLSDATLDAWAALLRRLPAARLLLKGKPFADRPTQQLFRARLGERGVAAERVELVGWLDEGADHLALYHRLDIALDPFPYNGTTTTCEALWMGVPVVSLCGDRHAGRVGASLLKAVGLDELLAASAETYVEIAASLARPERLAELRRNLRPRMASSPLCDVRGFTRTLDSAYRAMWRRWCSGRDR